MIEKLSKTIVNYQSEVGIIQKENINVYQYGYTLMAEVILNVFISVVLGLALDQIKEVIFFLCMFIPLRSFAGGYHAKKAWKCVILSNLVVVSVVLGARWMLVYEISLAIKILFVIISSSVIIKLSPVENCNRKLNIREKKMCKFYSIIILFVELLIMYVFFTKGNLLYSYIVVCSLCIHALSLIFGLLELKNNVFKYVFKNY